MDYTMVFTKMFAIYMVVAAVGILVNRKAAMKMISQFKDNYALVYTIGAITLLLGGFMVSVHNLWFSPNQIVISIIAWSVLLKGAVAMISPESLMRMAATYKSEKKLMSWGVVVLIIGLYLAMMTI